MVRTTAVCVLLFQLVLRLYAADISGIVRDPFGAPITGATVRLEGRRSQLIRTGPQGDFRFAVEPGRYRLSVTAEGFVTYSRALTTDGLRSLSQDVTLELDLVRQQITVRDRPDGLSLESTSNQDSPSASGSELAALPTIDGDYITALLRFVDSSAIGSNGVSVIVDGHEGPSSRVPMSMVKEVRINNNPYAAQFYGPGRGRIEVITKNPDPGYHGDLQVLLRDFRLNARDPFATEKPAEQWRTYRATITGPLGRGKRNFFMLSGDRMEQDSIGIVYALTPSGLLRENVPTPRHQNWFTARWNRRYGKDRSFWLGYEHDGLVGRSQTVGGQVLPEAGIDNGHFWNEVLVSDQGLLSEKLSHSLRGWVGHVGYWTSGRSDAPAVIVAGAFTGGSAQKDSFTPRTYFVVTDILTYVRGRHTVTFGGEIQELTRYAASIRDNFGGSYFYPSLDEYRLGRPSVYTRNYGTGHGVYGTIAMGSFAQDEWQIASGLSLQYGARYYCQNHYGGDWNNLAPRASLAWAPGRKRKVVLRGGMGIFYDRQPPINLVETTLYDGRRIGRLVQNTMDPPSNAPGISRMDPEFRIPSSVHFNGTVEYLLTSKASLAIAAIGARGIGVLRSRDMNAPIGMKRPDPHYSQIRNIDSSAGMERNAVEVTARGVFTKQISGTAQYTYGSLRSDTEGIAFFPANSYDPTAEWARADTDVRHRFSMLLTANGGPWLQFGVGTTFASGIPVNVTTGADDNHDGITNDRPAGVGRNTMAGPALAQVDVRWSRRFAARDKPLAATFSLDAFNVLNSVNYTTYVGVLSSPYFGRPVAAHPSRRMQVQVRFEF